MRSNHKISLVSALALFVATLAGCATTIPEGTAHMQASADDYRTLKLASGTVERWEDGMRTSGAKGSYEWWYFDSVLSDGSTLVIVFYTKDELDPASPLKPMVRFDLTRPDGTKVDKLVRLGAETFSASRESCDVRIGDNRVTGDLDSYKIHIAIDDIAADIELVRGVPSWRPETGVIAFTRDRAHSYFAWLPSVPQGRISGTLTVAGKTESIDGSGYHDHNWGDAAIMDIIHDWYWGRAQVGPYTVIASWITAADAYGNDVVPIFMLAKDGKIVADDCSRTSLKAEGVRTNAKTGKPVADRLVYEYDDGATMYRVSFDREANLEEAPFTRQMTAFERFFARLIGFDGAYHRFTGSVTVERLENAQVVETATEDSGVWELMYFGRAPK